MSVREKALSCVAVAAIAFLSGATCLAGTAENAALKSRIQDMVDGVRDVPLPLIVEALSGHAVIPWNGELKDDLAAVAEDVRAAINAGGITAGRVNEAGNLVERYVERALEARGFRAAIPVAPSGHARSAGYPDLEVMKDDVAFYVEVKAFSARTKDSTQRSFYLSPSADFKVAHDAHHLLIAVELKTAARGLYRAASVRWLDLSRLKCDLKYEFNANNRDLYGEEAGLVIIERGIPGRGPPVD